jgi:predicted adenine nucleotide alpha hydrolase (AANH) superfamily ATPase
MTDKKCEPSGCTWEKRSNQTTGVIFDPLGSGMMRPKLLLHSCCGPCSTAVIERLIGDYEITVYYYNPCITDQQEYEKRKANQIKFIEAINKKAGCEAGCVNFIEGDYEPTKFLEKVKGLEGEPEGGKRCTQCFRMRLEKTAAFAAMKGYPLFTTTLTVSPHKNYQLISEIGRGYAEDYGIEFLDMDFKKKAGFQRSVQLSKEYGLYRQDYCGCDFSKR